MFMMTAIFLLVLVKLTAWNVSRIGFQRRPACYLRPVPWAPDPDSSMRPTTEVLRRHTACLESAVMVPDWPVPAQDWRVPVQDLQVLVQDLQVQVQDWLVPPQDLRVPVPD